MDLVIYKDRGLSSLILIPGGSVYKIPQNIMTLWNKHETTSSFIKCIYSLKSLFSYIQYSPEMWISVDEIYVRAIPEKTVGGWWEALFFGTHHTYIVFFLTPTSHVIVFFCKPTTQEFYLIFVSHLYFNNRFIMSCFDLFCVWCALITFYISIYVDFAVFMYSVHARCLYSPIQ